jgi:hypothetical protein
MENPKQENPWSLKKEIENTAYYTRQNGNVLQIYFPDLREDVFSFEMIGEKERGQKYPEIKIIKYEETSASSDSNPYGVPKQSENDAREKAVRLVNEIEKLHYGIQEVMFSEK